MPESKSKILPIGCISLAVLAALGIFAFTIVILAAMSMGKENIEPVGPSIAHIDLEGVITSSQVASWMGGSDSMVQRFTKRIQRVRKSEHVKAVVIRINSPGGEVTASDVLYNQIKKTAEKKPVVIYMDSAATSGGFYAACGGTEIMANPTTITGSIGVIISTLKYKSLYQKVGMDSVVFTSGKFKDTLSGGRDMREDEKKLIQDMVDQTYERFLSIVKKARKDIPEAKLRNQIADGRIISGANALEMGLIDSNGYIEDAYERARKLSKSPKAKVFRVKDNNNIFSTLGMASSRVDVPQQIQLTLPEQLGTQLKPGMMYLLPPLFAH